MNRRFLILGAGYSAKAFAAARSSDPPVAISGTTRSEEKFSALELAGIAPLAFDGHGVSPELSRELARATHLVVSIAPDGAGDPVLRALGSELMRTARLRWIGYLSTVGVYGDHAGRWVDEKSDCRPVSDRSRRRVEAEMRWLALGGETGTPVAVLRLSGIYGPGRNALVNLKNATAKRLIKPGQVFNRIHATDIAGVLWHLAGEDRGGVFNVTDDLPAPPQDVVTYAARLMGVEPPPEIPFEAAQLSPMARSFYGENKRVSNAAIRRTGYRFIYPDYMSAFDAMWRQGNWAGDGEKDARSRMKWS